MRVVTCLSAMNLLETQNPYASSTIAVDDPARIAGTAPSLATAAGFCILAFLVSYGLLASLQDGDAMMDSLSARIGLDRFQAAFQMINGAGLSLLCHSPLLSLIRRQRPSQMWCFAIGLACGAIFVVSVWNLSPRSAVYLFRSNPLGAARPFFPIAFGLCYAAIPSVLLGATSILVAKRSTNSNEVGT